MDTNFGNLKIIFKNVLVAISIRFFNMIFMLTIITKYHLNNNKIAQGEIIITMNTNIDLKT